MRAADRAVGILPQLQLAESHLQRVVNHEAPDQRFTDADEQLDRLGRLDYTDDARQHAEYTALRATRYESGWRRFRVQAPIARAFFRREHRCLAFEAEDAAVGVGFAKQDARVVHKITGRKIVGAVEDYVVRSKQLECVFRRQRRLVGLDLDVRIDRVQSVAGRRELGPPDIR